MYTLKSKVIATGVIAFTLLAAAPVFAESISVNGDSGLKLGLFARFLQEERKEDRKAEREQHRADRDDRKETRKHNATSTATTTKQVSINGTITFVSGSTLTIQGSKGAVYTVNASSAIIVGHEGRTITLSALAVNDKVEVKGSLVNNVIVATKIKDTSDRTGKVFQIVKLGTVTAINGSTVTLANFGSQGNTVVTTNTATNYKVNGTAASSSALTVGSHVWIYGTTSATSSSAMNASLVVIITDGINWLKHFWK